VEITISVTPPAATIYVDDAQVPGNPFKAKFPKGGMHRVTASAAGYAPKSQNITFETNVVASIALDRATPGTAVNWSLPRGGGATPAPANDATPAGGSPAVPVAAAPPSEPTPPPATTATSAPANTGAPGEVSPRGGVAPVHKIDSTNPYAN
jgi:serine/threonine-protein kinase